MPHKRPSEPIAPANIPGQPLDPKIPPDQMEDDPDANDDAADDDVGTDERGNEMLSAHDPLGANARTQLPDASSDRLASPAAGRPPLQIREIESLEDDAKGG